MMLTYHISHENFFSTALSVPGRSGVKYISFANSCNLGCKQSGPGDLHVFSSLKNKQLFNFQFPDVYL